jgi:3-oxoacyl-[acyl-carrier-protein] synthase II
MSSVRVAVTGMGAISPLGLSSQEMWAGLCSGKSGIGKITAFDPAGFSCKIAGQVPEYKVQNYIPKNFRKSVKLMCRDIELSIVAAQQAIVDSGLVTAGIDPEKVNVKPERFAINIGAGLISPELVELAPAVAASKVDGKFDIRKWGKDGIELVTPLWLLKYLPNMPACHIGIIHDLRGPSNSIMCAEAASHVSISEACDIIMRGASDMALAGGTESKVNPLILAKQCIIGRANTSGDDDPQEAYRPFDAKASGSVFGEGSGMVVLENLELAKARGAKIYAEIAGTGQSNDINGKIQHLSSEGKGLRIAIEKAIADAGISAGQIDLVIPHGTGIAIDDLAEAKAIEAVLGTSVSKVPVWPTKSMLSNTGAACGSLDVIAAIYAIRDGVIPASKNLTQKAQGCNLNIVTESLKKEIKYALCCGYTYGGQTAALVIKKFDGNN